MGIFYVLTVLAMLAAFVLVKKSTEKQNLINFCILSAILYLVNRGIKKGVKPFFEQEKQEVPKLPNKSITLIILLLLEVQFHLRHDSDNE